MSINNQVTLVGYVAIQPRFKEGATEDKSELFYTLGVSRNYKNNLGKYEIDYIPINVYGKQALYMNQKLQKGTLLLVTGSLQATKWTEEKPKTSLYFYQNGYRILGGAVSTTAEDSETFVPQTEAPFIELETSDFLRNEY